MFKEKGYDEFLAKKIAKGMKDFEQGKYLTEQETRQRIEQLISRIIIQPDYRAFHF